MKLLKIRIERLLATLFIPYAVINISKASKEMFISAIFIQALFFIVVYYGTRETRKAIIEDYKDGYLNEYIEDIERYIEPIKQLIKALNDTYKRIKKEDIRSKTNDQVKRCFKNITSM